MYQCIGWNGRVLKVSNIYFSQQSRFETYLVRYVSGWFYVLCQFEYVFENAELCVIVSKITINNLLFSRSVVKKTFSKCGSQTRSSVIWRKCWIFTPNSTRLLFLSNSSSISVSEASIKNVLYLFTDVLGIHIIKQF